MTAFVTDHSAKPGAMRIAPYMRQEFIDQGMAQDDAKAFSDTDERTSLEVWKAKVAALPVSVFAAEMPAASAMSGLSPLQQKMVHPDGLLARGAPGAVRRIREAEAK